jgi:hypothetical protein
MGIESGAGVVAELATSTGLAITLSNADNARTTILAIDMISLGAAK